MKTIVQVRIVLLTPDNGSEPAQEIVAEESAADWNGLLHQYLASQPDALVHFESAVHESTEFVLIDTAGKVSN